MSKNRISTAISRAVSSVIGSMVTQRRTLGHSPVERLEDRRLFATYVVEIDSYLTQGNAGNANTGTLTLKDDNRIENPAGATEDDRIKTAIDAAIQSASATTTPPGTTYSYPDTSRFKIAKFSDIAGLTIPSGYTSDDWVIGFEDLTDNDFNDGFWAAKVEVDDGYDDDESEAEDDVGNCCEDDGSSENSDDSAGTNGESKDTDCPISYHDGTVNIAETDFTGNGFGVNWSTTRNWSNELTLEGDKTIGNGWMLGSRPFLQQSGDDIKLVTNGRDAKWFEGSGGSYTPRFHTTGSFVTSGSDFIYRDSSGQTFTFWGFGSAQPGQLKEMTTRGGVATSLTYASGQLTEVNRSQVVGSDTIYERYVYTYLTTGDNTGKISNIDQQRKINAGSWSTVREADYTYYNIKNGAGTADDPGGNVGDLKRVVVKDGSGNTITTSYYRYWEHVIDGSGKFTQPANGYVGGLKYVVTGASYNRLAQAVGASNVDSTSDATLATYANHYFEYNKDREATKEIAQGEGCSTCTGGLGSFTYSRTKSAHAKSFNNWAVKTIETLPDGNQNIVYTNGYGKIMLKAYKETATGNQWIEYWRYDANGRVMRHAAPSAVTGYDDSTYADLVNYNSGANTAQYLSDSSGLIEIFEYGTSTTATSSVAGDVTGYLKSTSLQNGDTGTAVLQVSRTYIARTGGSNTIYPVASETIYRNTGGTGGQTTNYTYTWIGSTTQMATRTVSLPAATTAQNGSNAAVTAVTYFDTYGRAIWVVDGDGYITYNEYDQNTGAMTKQVVDANPGSISGAPVSGPTRSGSLPTALGLTTTMLVDNLGRMTKVTDPNGNVTYKVYDDDNHEVRVYRGWNATTGTTTGPIQVVRQDRARGYAERLTMSATPTTSGSSGSYVPTGAESISNLQSLTRDVLNAAGQVVYRDVYTTSGLTYSTNVTIGTAGTDYLRTEIGYDDRGRQARVKRADGTWTHTVYDGLGRAVSTWKGTDNTGWTQTNPAGSGGSNNMLKVSETIYDNDGVGDSNVTESRQVVGNGSTAGTDFYATKYQYDFRNRLTGTRGPDNVAAKFTFDNLGQQTTLETFADSDADFVIDSGELRGKTVQLLDERGQLYRTTTHEVDSATGTSPGTVRDGFTVNFWFDARGNLIKTQDPSQRIDKNFYDGAGRLFRSSIVADLTEAASGTYADADDLTSDQVIEQTDFWLDKAGRTRLVTNWMRDGSESSTLTGLPTAGHFDHNVIGYWYDAADRLIGIADYGRDGAENGGTSGNQLVWNSTGYSYKDSDSDGIPNVIDVAQDALPALSNYSGPTDTSYDYIRTQYIFDAAGRLQDVVDNANRTVRTTYDLAGRTLKTVENYVNGTATETETDTDRTTEYVYDAFGRLQQLKALNPKGSGNGVETQTTVYLYASNIDRSWVSFTLYPDSTSTYSINSTTGVASITAGTDHVSCTFDRLGRKDTCTDQRGVVLDYNYDSAGRLSEDIASTIVSGVDGRVRRIGYTYDDLSRPFKVTSYDATTSGNVVNEVQYVYDGWGNVTRTYQAHDGTVNTGSTPFIEYIYEDGGNDTSTGVADYVRLFEMNYPNANPSGRGSYRPLYEATADIGIVLNRLKQMKETGGAQLVEYRWLGAATLTQQILHPLVSGGLVMYNGAKSNDYEGWDRYYRTKEIDWRKTNASVQFEERFYTYDRMGNRLTLDSNGSLNGVDAAGSANWDETYAYDGLNRLTDFKRGTISSGSIASPKFQQTWTLDSLGNWRGYNQTNNDTALLSGTVYPTFTQTRTNNAVNEITGITGGSFAGTGYDAAGNMTAGPKTGAESTSVYFKYDAWNRQASLDANNDGDLLDSGDWQYEYDGIGRRISKWQDTVNDSTNNVGAGEEFYYNDDWQNVETRVATTTGGSKTIDPDPKERILWDLTYIDAPAMVEFDTNTDGTRDQRLWPTWDANYNVTALLTDSGVTVERYAYTPYGQQIVINGDQNYANSGADPDGAEWTVDTNGSDFGFVASGFQGLRYDTENGTWLARSRPTGPVVQFLQQDKIKYEGGSANLYGFVGQNPIGWVDPFGFEADRQVHDQPQDGISYVDEHYHEFGSQIPNQRNVDAVMEVSKMLKNLGSLKSLEWLTLAAKYVNGGGDTFAEKAPKDKCTVNLYFGHAGDSPTREESIGRVKNALGNPISPDNKACSAPAFGMYGCWPRDYSDATAELNRIPGDQGGVDLESTSEVAKRFNSNFDSLLRRLDSMRECCKEVKLNLFFGMQDKGEPQRNRNFERWRKRKAPEIPTSQPTTVPSP